MGPVMDLSVQYISQMGPVMDLSVHLGGLTDGYGGCPPVRGKGL